MVYVVVAAAATVNCPPPLRPAIDKVHCVHARTQKARLDGEEKEGERTTFRSGQDAPKAMRTIADAAAAAVVRHSSGTCKYFERERERKRTCHTHTANG